MLDNGKPAEIALFSSEPQPFTAVVMMDTSASMTANLKLLNRAAEQFLLRLLPVDRAQVGAFNDKIQLSGTFTNDRDELIAALDDLYFGNPTRLNDAIAASLDALEGIDGRRVVLVFTDGEDTASRIGFGKVLERSRDEEVMVYSIGLESEYFNGVRVVRSKPSRDLRKIAEETGGGYFELQQTVGPRSYVQPRRDRAAEPVPDCVHAADARRQGAQARSAREPPGDDGPSAQELSGSDREVLSRGSCLDEHRRDKRECQQHTDDGFGRRGEIPLVDPEHDASLHESWTEGREECSAGARAAPGTSAVHPPRRARSDAQSACRSTRSTSSTLPLIDTTRPREAGRRCRQRCLPGLVRARDVGRAQGTRRRPTPARDRTSPGRERRGCRRHDKCSPPRG